MNLETINVWGQLIASTGVIVSLFYVAAQRLDRTNGQGLVVHEADILRAWISELRRKSQRSARCPLTHTANAN